MAQKKMGVSIIEMGYAFFLAGYKKASLSLSLSLSLYLSLSLSSSRSRSLSLSLSQSLSLPFSLSLALTHTHTHILSLSLFPLLHLYLHLFLFPSIIYQDVIRLVPIKAKLSAAAREYSFVSSTTLQPVQRFDESASAASPGEITTRSSKALIPTRFRFTLTYSLLFNQLLSRTEKVEVRNPTFHNVIAKGSTYLVVYSPRTRRRQSGF